MKIIRLVIEDSTASSTAFYEPLLFEELSRLLKRSGLRLISLETEKMSPRSTAAAVPKGGNT